MKRSLKSLNDLFRSMKVLLKILTYLDQIKSEINQESLIENLKLLEGIFLEISNL